MKKVCLLLMMLAMCAVTFAQYDPMMKEVMRLMNAARTNPAGFLAEHKVKLDSLSPAYVTFLGTAKRLNPLIWDDGLLDMARRRVEMSMTDQKYEGDRIICGDKNIIYQSTGLTRDPLTYVVSLYQDVHKRSHCYFGAYDNLKHTEAAYIWGSCCEKPRFPFTYEGTVDTSTVNFKLLNTAANAVYADSLDKKMIQEINFLRAYPKVYAQIVGREMHARSLENEGLEKKYLDATVALMAMLEGMEPLPLLQSKNCMFRAAEDHAKYCQNEKVYREIGYFQSTPQTRVRSFCPECSTGEEMAMSDFSPSPRQTVIDMLVKFSDVEQRKKDILAPDWKYVGCVRYLMQTTAYFTQHMWVVDFGK